MGDSVNLRAQLEEQNQNIQSDIEVIFSAFNSAESSIRSEMNFLKYYHSVLEVQQLTELNCLNNNGGLFKLILSVYATYEFAVKRMLLDALEFIDKRSVKVDDLQTKIKALYFKEEIDDIRKKIGANEQGAKENISKKLVKIFEHLTASENFEAKDSMIDTNSNLKFDTLCELLSYFEFDRNKYTPYEKYIKALVHYRNNVAHGNTGFIDTLPTYIMPIKQQNYEVICEKIIELLRILYKDIEDFLIFGKYKA